MGGMLCKEDAKSDQEDMAPFSSQEKDSKVCLEDFDLLKVLGEGSFGKVFLVRKKDNKRLYAMKVLRKEYIAKRNQKFNTKTERELLQKMSCPFIIKLHYAFQTQDKLYMVMDFANGGELFTHLRKAEGRRFSEKRARFYAAELILGLEYMHGNGIIYRDLKPENVLLDKDGHIKITDFGLSKKGVTDGVKTQTLCGTPEYLAPEVIKDMGHDKAVDYWSLGALTYEMLSGLPPFYSKDRQEMLRNIVEKDVIMHKSFSPQAASFLTQLLRREPTERLSDPAEIKRHEFFAGIDWDKLARRELQPPFRLKLKGEDDVTFFDPTFTEKEIKHTPAPGFGGTYGGGTYGGTYTGFTFDESQVHGGPQKDTNAKRNDQLFEPNPYFDDK